MTSDERDIISRFIQRVSGAAAPGGSVPGTAPALPPIDPEADALIADLFARSPQARYRITQMALVQEHALVEAQNRIQQLQWQLNNAQAQQAPVWGGQPPPVPQPSRGLFGGLFGGGSPPPPQPPQPQYAPPPPPPQYPPGYNPGMFQRGGSGFLGSALTTAAGVAGGMLAGHALMNLFSGGGGAAAAMPSSATINEFVQAPASPWGGGGTAPTDPYDAGGAAKGDPAGWADPSQGWQQPTQDSGWQDASNAGWDDPGTLDPGGDMDSGWDNT